MSEEGIPVAPEPESGEVEQATETGAESSGVNYHDRIRTEPDFAVDEVRNKDRYIGELHEKVNRFKGLDQYVDVLGSPEKLAELAELGHRVQSDPKLLDALRRAVSGEPAAVETPAESEDEIYDPEIRSMNEKWAKRFEQQEQIISDLKSRLDRTEVNGLKVGLTENMEDALSRFKDDPEMLEEAKAEIQRAVEHSERSAAAGDRSAAQSLEQLAGPGGKRTLKMLTADIYERYAAKKLDALSSTREPDGEIMDKATDPRVPTRSTPAAPTVSVAAGAKVTSKTVADIMAQVSRSMGKDPDRLFG